MGVQVATNLLLRRGELAEQVPLAVSPRQPILVKLAVVAQTGRVPPGLPQRQILALVAVVAELISLEIIPVVPVVTHSLSPAVPVGLLAMPAIHLVTQQRVTVVLAAVAVEPEPGLSTAVTAGSMAVAPAEVVVATRPEMLAALEVLAQVATL